MHGGPLQSGHLLGCGGAGDEYMRLRRGFEDAGGKDRQKVGHDALPVDLAQTADDHIDRDSLDVKGQGVANANAQGGGDACFQGDVEGVARGLAAPRAGDDLFGLSKEIAVGRAVLGAARPSCRVGLGCQWYRGAWRGRIGL